MNCAEGEWWMGFLWMWEDIGENYAFDQGVHPLLGIGGSL